MSSQNGIGYTVVTNTGDVLGTPTNGNYVVYGYSIKQAGAAAALSVNDAGYFVFGIPAVAGAAANTDIWDTGVVFQGAITVTGVSTNVSNVTIFYTKQ